MDKVFSFWYGRSGVYFKIQKEQTRGGLFRFTVYTGRKGGKWQRLEQFTRNSAAEVSELYHAKELGFANYQGHTRLNSDPLKGGSENA